MRSSAPIRPRLHRRSRIRNAHFQRRTNSGTLWPKCGYDESDNVDGGSDRLIDMLVAWGGAAEIQRQVDEYYEAGATQVVLMSGSRSEVDGGIIEQLAPNAH